MAKKGTKTTKVTTVEQIVNDTDILIELIKSTLTTFDSTCSQRICITESGIIKNFENRNLCIQVEIQLLNTGERLFEIRYRAVDENKIYRLITALKEWQKQQ